MGREPLPVYRQTHPRSCLAASLLMVLHHFEPKKYPLTGQKEMEIYDKIKFKHEELYGGSYSKAADFLLREGYEVRFYLGGLPYDPFPPDLVRYGETLHEFIVYLNRALQKRRFHLVIDPQGHGVLDKEIDTLLGEGYKVIVYLHRRRHNAVVFEKEGQYYRLLDPLRGMLRLSGHQLKKEMYSPWGYTLMAVRKPGAKSSGP